MAKEIKKTKKNEEQTSNFTKILLLAVIIVAACYFAYTIFIKKDEIVNKPVVVDPRERIKNIPEPPFKKEGELEFLQKDGKTLIKKIDIELAENDQERAQGMMYRKSMDDEKGMLFTFNKEEPQEFWMKNTIIPLDIMYVNHKKEIVKIFKNTTPFSEKPLPSEKPSMFVVEVYGGFTDRYGIKEGDMISYLKK